MNSTAYSVLATLAFGFVLGSAHHLDAPTDNRDEWRVSSALSEAIKDEDAALRRERAARAICAETHGLNASVRWTEDGSLVCSSKHGRGTITHAALVAPMPRSAP